jgi:transposase
VVRFGELIVILELRQHGMSVSAIARRTGLSRGTIRKYITRGIEPPAYGPRAPRPSLLAPYEPYLPDRIAAFRELTGSRLHREIRELGYSGGYTAVKDFLREVGPRQSTGFEVRFETPPGARPRWTSRISGLTSPLSPALNGSSGWSRRC